MSSNYYSRLHNMSEMRDEINSNENKIEELEKQIENMKEDIASMLVEFQEYFEDRHDINENGGPNKAMQMSNEIEAFTNKYKIEL